MKRLLLILVLSLRCYGTIALVQSNTGGTATQHIGSGTVTTSAVGFVSDTSSGDLLVCIAWSKEVGDGNFHSTQSPVFSTPVTSGITWTNPVFHNGWIDAGTNNSGEVAIFYVANAPTVLSSTTTTVTAIYPGGGNFTSTIEFSLYEFSGIATSSPVDTHAFSGFSASGTPTGGTIAPATVNDLLMVSYAGIPSGTAGVAASGYSLGVAAASATIAQSQYNLTASSGSQSTVFGSGTFTLFGGLSIAFKPLVTTSRVLRHKGSVF